ncbi:MAG: hypothetical protein AAB403_12395 [Planctomycetota bacterium]
MVTKIAEYEHELQEVRRRRREVTAQLKTLTQEDQELTNVEHGWEAIVAMERKRTGESAPAPTANTPDIGALSVQVAGSLQTQDGDEEEGENKTQFVRDQIRANAATGMMPKDLKKAAAAAGMKHPASWPYGPLQRLKKSGEVIKRKGRFYPGKGAANTQSNSTLVG